MNIQQKKDTIEKTLIELKACIQAIPSAEDRELSETMVILLTAAHVGPSVETVAKCTGYSYKQIETIAQKMTANGLWTDTDVDTSEWWDGDSFYGEGLFSHALVALGRVRRCEHDGIITYSDVTVNISDAPSDNGHASIDDFALIKSTVEDYIDPKNRELYEAALVMVAALFVGPDVSNIANMTGLPIGQVTEVGQRLQISRLWVGDRCDYQDWGNDRVGGITFIMDACVAAGSLIRTSEKRNGKYIYMSATCVN